MRIWEREKLKCDIYEIWIFVKIFLVIINYVTLINKINKRLKFFILILIKLCVIY